MHKKPQLNRFTTKAFCTGHVQLHVLSSSVNETDFKTILLIFLPSCSEEFQQKPGMTVRLLTGIFNTSVNNTRTERIRCDKSFKKPGTSWSHRKSNFFLNRLSWSHNNQDIFAFPAICHLKHTPETSKTLKLCISQVIYCNSYYKLEKIFAGLGLKTEDLSLLILTNLKK